MSLVVYFAQYLYEFAGENTHLIVRYCKIRRHEIGVMGEWTYPYSLFNTHLLELTEPCDVFIQFDYSDSSEHPPLLYKRKLGGRSKLFL